MKRTTQRIVSRCLIFTLTLGFCVTTGKAANVSSHGSAEAFEGLPRTSIVDVFH